MSGRVQGPPRGGLHPTMKALVMLVAGAVCMGAALVSAWMLVTVATWAWDMVGGWLLILIVGFVGWMVAMENRRWDQ